jgi:hypothetical protein
MQQDHSEIIIIVSTSVVFLFTFTLVILFSFFQKRKNFLLQEQQISKENFQREIIETQIEIREQTLRNISWELHDNIGQLLTLAKIQLQNNSFESINETLKTISHCLEEVRVLSKMINPEAIRELTLKKAIQLEVNRFSRFNFLKISFQVIGEEIHIKPTSTIVIFRILQEFLANTIKHSKAKSLDIKLDYLAESLRIIIKDDGVGFNRKQSKNEKGIGLTNMENRAKLIGAKLNLTSRINIGTILIMTYKL